MRAMRRLVILELIGIFAQRTRMAVMSGFRASRLGILPPPLAIARRRFRRRPRRLVRPLQSQQHVDEFFLAQLQQFFANHAPRDSDFSESDKRREKTRKWGVGNYYTACLASSFRLAFASNGSPK